MHHVSTHNKPRQKPVKIAPIIKFLLLTLTQVITCRNVFVLNLVQSGYCASLEIFNKLLRIAFILLRSIFESRTIFIYEWITENYQLQCTKNQGSKTIFQVSKTKFTIEGVCNLDAP